MAPDIRVCRTVRKWTCPAYVESVQRTSVGFSSNAMRLWKRSNECRLAKWLASASFCIMEVTAVLASPTAVWSAQPPSDLRLRNRGGHQRQAGNHLSGGEHHDLQRCSGAGLALVKPKAAIVAFATAEARALIVLRPVDMGAGKAATFWQR